MSAAEEIFRVAPPGIEPTRMPMLRSTRADIYRRLLDKVNPHEMTGADEDTLREEWRRRATSEVTGMALHGPEKDQVVKELIDHVFGLGPLEPLLSHPKINDILVNGVNDVYVEVSRVGMVKTDVTFDDEEQLMTVIDRIARKIGRRVDESSPMLDARLVEGPAEGSRVNAIIRPLALDGPAISIRKFSAEPLTHEQLIGFDALTKEMAYFLSKCVQCKMNILLSGGTGSGKTTTLNMLSRWIPGDERVLTIEDAAELMLQRDHVVRMETRQANVEGKGEVSQRELLVNTLRMRPDRIIIGEVRGAEALDMLQAMNTGHEGSMTTIHANSSRDAFGRIENMVAMAGLNFPVEAIRQQMTSALDMVIQVSRLTGSVRKMVSVSEITGMNQDVVLMQDIFRFKQTGISEDGKAEGVFEACGIRPQLLPKLEAEGVYFPDMFFQHRVLGETTGYEYPNDFAG